VIDTGNPYVGPRAFPPDKTLYGREDESRALLDLLIAERIVLLYSPSGAGKTSLIQAKVIAEMGAEDYQVLPVVRPGADINTREQSDTGNPFVARVVAACEEGRPEGEPPLADVPGITLASYLSQRSWIRGDPRLKLLILDQFEEVLTAKQDEEEKVAFFEQLGEALRNQQIWALFAMREEYSAALDRYRHLLPTRLASHFRLELLGLKAAREAICNPAKSAVVLCHGKPVAPPQTVRVLFDDDALEQLVTELATVRERASDGTILARRLAIVEPLYLQIVCHQLWEKLPPDTRWIGLEHLGRDTEHSGGGGGVVEQALEEYYATVVGEVAARGEVRERFIRDWLGQELITPQGLRRQVPQGQYETAGLANELVEALAGHMLLRSDARSGTLWYEVAHDRLVEMIIAGNSKWFARNLAPFQIRAARWDLLRRNGATEEVSARELFKGDDLDEAEEWQRQRSESEVSAVDRDFLHESRKAWDNGSWKRKARFWVPIVTSVVIGVWAFSVLKLNDDLTHQRARATAGALLSAAAAERWRGHDHELASLLAIQAHRFAARRNEDQKGGFGYRVEEALRGALQERPFTFGTMLPRPSNVWLARQHGLIAIKTGPKSLNLSAFPGGPRDPREIEISLDANLIGAVFVSDDPRLAVLTASGMELHALVPNPGSKTKLLSLTTGSPPSGPFCISPDGKGATIVVASGGVEIWSLASGVAEFIASLTAAELALPDKTAITALACNIAAGRLAWGNEQGDVGILKLSSGKARTHWVSHNRFAEWPEPLQEALKDRKDTLDYRVTALRHLPQQLVAVYRQGPPRIYDLRADGSAPSARYLHPNGRSDAALEMAQDRGWAPRNIVTLPSYLSADASEDGRWLAVGGTRGEVGLWNLASLTAEADARPGKAARPAGGVGRLRRLRTDPGLGRQRWGDPMDATAGRCCPCRAQRRRPLADGGQRPRQSPLVVPRWLAGSWLPVL
jgi:hypothetical protein